MLLINFEINLLFNSFSTCALSNDTKLTTFAKTDIKLYVPLVILSIQDNAKRKQQLKSGFKITNNWNKNYSKVTIQTSNLYLDCMFLSYHLPISE